MSADNGIYILKTKDNQIRVSHSKAIDGLFDSDGKYIYSQIQKHFNDKPFTRNMRVANKIAQKIYNNLPVCEYGIRVLPVCDKTWEQIVKGY